MLFSNPINFVETYAPITPTGNERSTDSGKRKLSYCAASMKYTNRILNINMKSVWLPAEISSRVSPENAISKFDGNEPVHTSCTARMASPEEYPGAAAPLTLPELNRLKRFTDCAPYTLLTDTNSVIGAISPFPFL